MQLPQIRFTISLLLAILAFDSVSSQDPLLVPLTWETADYEFVATLGVGTPAHPFRLVVDTGSANLWIPSSTCTSLACTQRAQYNPQQSSTSKVLGTQVPISYGAGQVDSILVQDVISLPAPGNSSGGASGSGSSFTPGAAFTQTLGVAVKMRIDNSSSSAQQPWDGIMGMGLPKLAAGGVKPPVLSMYQQGTITQPRFGLYLIQDSNRPGAGGEMAIGGYNKQRVAGDLTWVDVVSPQLPVQQGFWSVPVTSVGLTFPAGSSKAAAGACSGFTGDSSSNSPAGCIGILDSGTSQMIGSIDQVAVLNAALGGVPSIKQLPFNCGTVVGEVLSATAQALSSSDPNAAANQVCSSMFGPNAANSLAAILCGAVQQEFFLAQQQAPNSPAQELLIAQQRSMAFCQQLPYASNVTLDCNVIATMPNITFNIGGKAFSVPVGDYAYQDATNRQCYSKISALGALGPGAWVLGSSFMQNLYTVFDYGGQGREAGTSNSAMASRGLKQAAASAVPRVGLGKLTAAEQAAAQAAFDQGLAGKNGGWSSTCGCWCLQLALAVAVLLPGLL